MAAKSPMTNSSAFSSVLKLASYQRCAQRIQANWPAFVHKRQSRLQQQERHGVASEKVAENILEDLFTEVLDWDVADLNNQLEYADLVLSKGGMKYLIVEVKRPGALTWNQHAVEHALDQVIRYAGEQRVSCVAISDGVMLYAANLKAGGLMDRVFLSLTSLEAPQDLWWLSVHGIYRPCSQGPSASRLLPQELPTTSSAEESTDCLLHPKYQLPASCFAYVGNPSKTSTWKLPFRLADGHVDERRLPKAIQALLSNYRGAKVGSIPEAAIPAVLERLAIAAESLGRMPHQRGDTASIYVQFAEALEQIRR